MDEFEPTRVTGVVRERVGRPPGGGTAGSGLYAVPLQLSGAPSSAWGKSFEQCWNHPPSFTTMHRAGIARVTGDTIVLDGTTIDEVERYHLATVKLCIEAANEAELRRLERDRQQSERDEVALREHQAHVDDVADRLRFDEK